MKISFVIPAYNEEQLLPKCLNSVSAEINRNSNIKIEVIVVNNASTDNTKAIALNFDFVKVVDENKKGLVWARRAGYLQSTGDIIANIDSDTLLPNGWLSKVITEFTNDPKLLSLSGPQIYYDAPISIRIIVKIWYMLGYIFNQINEMLFSKGSMLQGGNFVVRRSAMEKIGDFDTSLEFFGEDTALGKRLNKIGKVKWTFNLPIYASGRRILEKGILKTGYVYAMTFVYITFFDKPFTQKYDDVRKLK